MGGGGQKSFATCVILFYDFPIQQNESELFHLTSQERHVAGRPRVGVGWGALHEAGSGGGEDREEVKGFHQWWASIIWKVKEQYFSQV